MGCGLKPPRLRTFEGRRCDALTQASKAGHLASYQDLADTPLGPFDERPQSLRTAVATMMASGHTMCLFWGPERVFL